MQDMMPDEPLDIKTFVQLTLFNEKYLKNNLLNPAITQGLIEKTLPILILFDALKHTV